MKLGACLERTCGETLRRYPFLLSKLPLDTLVAQELKKHEEAGIRVAQMPGFGVDSAQQIIAEVGADAEAFPSASQFSSWAGTCPGSEESAEHNQSSRS